MQPARVFLAIVLLSLVALAAGCGHDAKLPEKPPHGLDTVGRADAFRVELGPGWVLDTVMAADLSGNGKPEYIVASHDTTRDSGIARPDNVQIYSYDSAARIFKPVFDRSLVYATDFQLRDVTGDGHADLIVTTNSGGNDIVASRGMQIYSWQADSVRLVFNSSRGNPLLAPMPRVAGEAIFTHDEFWPSRGAHVDAVEYVSDIFAFRNGAFMSVRKEQSKLFTGYAEKYLAEYRKAHDSLAGDTLRQANDSLRRADSLNAEARTTPSPLFVEPALAITSLSLAGQPGMIRSFWGSERDYIRKRLPGSDFRQLETLYTRSLDR